LALWSAEPNGLSRIKISDGFDEAGRPPRRPSLNRQERAHFASAVAEAIQNPEYR